MGLALGQLCHAPLFDNHVAIDFARSIFDFGAPGFWNLVMEVRLAALRTAAETPMPLLITTAAYSDPIDRPLFAQYEAVMKEAQAIILPVHLTCRKETLLKRVSSTDRAIRGKILTKETLDAYLDRNTFAPVPIDTCLTIDTDRLSPNDAAKHVSNHFGLTG